MIIIRTPFRIPLGGGGTDLPSYYSKHGGFIFSATIDKYMYTFIHRPLVDDLIRVIYSRSERVEKLSEVQHDIVRASLEYMRVENAIQIASIADIPAGTGLGSSSAYAVGLLHGLHVLKREYVPLETLAEEACHIEIDLLKKPIGKQDQYLAALGGFVVLEIDPDGAVHARRAEIADAVLDQLNANILFFYTGTSRSADDILKHQSAAAKRDEGAVVESLHRIKEIGREILMAIESGNLRRFGELLHEHWTTKKNLSRKVSDPRIDRLYEIARDCGALGGKIMGAGGGGFFLFYIEEGHQCLREAMRKENLREMRYSFDFEGTKLLSNFFSWRNRPCP
ncbi:MAG: galactokinase [bacterium]|nr:galactokinase [bacterium]